MLKFAASIGKGINALKNVADSTPFHSRYIANKIKLKQIQRLIDEGNERLVKKSLNHLKSKGITDTSGNPISKADLEKIFKKVPDGSVIGMFDMGDEVIDIVKKNGIIGVAFDKSKYQTVLLEAGLVANRNLNFQEAVKELKKSWVKDSSKIPKSIADAINESIIPSSMIRLPNMQRRTLQRVVRRFFCFIPMVLSEIRI